MIVFQALLIIALLCLPFAIMLALWAWLVRWTCRLVFSELDARAAARATMELRGSGGAGDAGSRRMV